MTTIAQAKTSKASPKNALCPPDKNTKRQSWKPSPSIQDAAQGKAHIRYGQKGEGVKQLQKLLRGSGHKIEADGKFGPKTKRALRTFQQAHGCKADGIAGPQTLAAFRVPTSKSTFEPNKDSQKRRAALRATGKAASPRPIKPHHAPKAAPTAIPGIRAKKSLKVPAGHIDRPAKAADRSASRNVPPPRKATDVTGSADNHIGTAAQLTGAASDLVEKAAPQVARALRTTSAAVSKVASRVSTAANVVGAVATFADQAANGTQSTTAGRVVNGTAAAGTGLAFGIANPVAATVDAISGAVGGPSLTEHTNRGIDALTTIAESAVTGDEKGLVDLNERNLTGQNGTPMQVAAGYGEALANGNTRHLENFQAQALRGEHGSIVQRFSEDAEFLSNTSASDVTREVKSFFRMVNPFN